MTAQLLRIEDLVVDHSARGWRARPFRALRGVSLTVHAGETLALIGESGSGKTTLGRAVLGLTAATSGRIVVDGHDLGGLSARQRRSVLRDVHVVFQDPLRSLNPSMRIADILVEPLVARGGATLTEARRRVGELLDRVRLPADTATRYPDELSGGQRQRVAIARALALDPRLIVCDEPVSALDGPTRMQVRDLLDEIQRESGVAYLLISHDLAVVRRLSHRVAVMRSGEIVEQGDTAEVTRNPQHPYTRRLILAAPVADPVRQQERRRLAAGGP